MKHERKHSFGSRTDCRPSCRSADSSSKDGLEKVLSHIKGSIRHRKYPKTPAATHRRNSIHSFHQAHYANVPRVKNRPSEQGYLEYYLRGMGQKPRKGRKERHEIQTSFKTPNWEGNARSVDLNKELPRPSGGEEVPNYSHPRKFSSASYSTAQISPGAQTIHVGLILNSPEDVGRTVGTTSSPVLYRRSVDSNYQLQPLTFTFTRPTTKIQDKFDFGTASQETPQEQHRRTSSTKFPPILESAEEPHEDEQRDSVDSVYTEVPGLAHDESSPESDRTPDSVFWGSRALPDTPSPRCQMPGHDDLSEHLRISNSRAHHWGSLKYPEERETHFCNACYKSMPHASVYLNRMTMVAAENLNLEELKTVSMATKPGVQKQSEGQEDESDKHAIVENVVEYHKHPYKLNSKFSSNFEPSLSPPSSSELAGRRRGETHGTSSASSSRASSSAWRKSPQGHVVECLSEPRARSPRISKSTIKLKPIIRKEDDWSDLSSVSSGEQIITSSIDVEEPAGIHIFPPSDKHRISSGLHGSFDEIETFYAEYVALYDYPREGHMIKYLENHGIKQEIDGSY
jgi:hypothetical protein